MICARPVKHHETLLFSFHASRLGKLRLTIGFDQHLLLTHVLDVDGAVDDVLRRGAVIVLHLLTLVTLDLKGISCSTQQEEDAEYSVFHDEMKQQTHNQHFLHSVRQ